MPYAIWHWHSCPLLLLHVGNGRGSSHCTCDAHNIVSLHLSLSTYPYPFLLSSTPLLARTVCFSRFVCSRSLALSVNLISFNALGLFAQLAAAVAAGVVGGCPGQGQWQWKSGAASAATEATLFVIKCEKYEKLRDETCCCCTALIAASESFPSPLVPCPLYSHAPSSCDTQFATAWTWPNFSFSLIAAPRQGSLITGLPLTAWQRLFIPCKQCMGVATGGI